MTLRRDPSKALQIGFLTLLVISIAQVGYWITDHVRYTRDIDRRLSAFFAGDFEPHELKILLPDLQIDPSASSASVRRQALDAIERDGASRINRFLWEGGFFLLVLFSGMAVLTRTIRHDAELRRRQQNFLAAVSHEFKSPLASIRLASETLVLRSHEPDSKRLGQRILEDGERLLRMVDNLLDTTRLEESRQQLAPTITPLHAAAQTAIAEVAERARLSDIQITLDVPADLELSVDPNALETMLRNLLDNAIKACVAGKGHAVTVRAQRLAEGIELAVNDDGLGFPPEDAAMIFEKFHRLGDELRRAMPGTGLGLYIVKRLVELSGARIEAHSEGAGRGATVTIRWPEQPTK
ncbi:MAG TPA: HAMP domain-containing sensor histidine kinase [Gammaproteobacteria bacterium]|nr:HAMP domain-containing sensor histidine kinase [Gammaproteobacteria bacterium]